MFIIGIFITSGAGSYRDVSPRIFSNQINMKEQFKIGDIVEVACDDHGRFELGEKIRLVRWDGQHFIAARADDELGVTWFIGAERIKKINNMKLEITKEKVLDAASKCSTAKQTLQVLFPEAFEVEDKNAFKKDVFDCSFDSSLAAFCSRAFGNDKAIQIADAAAYSSDHRLRSFYLEERYVAKIIDGQGGGQIITIHTK